MNMHPTIAPAPVRQEVVVRLEPQAAFAFFTQKFDAWWPRDKTSNMTAGVTLVEAVLEPWVGGRWYEKSSDGSECQWGSVLAYDPGKRLVLNWQLDSTFTYDPKLVTEVEVTFVPDGSGTRVTLEHRNLDRFGAGAEQMRKGIGGADGWPAIIQAFADAANH
jgi:uncharacterized protein YndB with AHSA1/START domain